MGFPNINQISIFLPLKRKPFSFLAKFFLFLPAQGIHHFSTTVAVE